jgi:hypothetical protein
VKPQEGAIVFRGVGIAGRTTVLEHKCWRPFAARGINQISPDCVLEDFSFAPNPRAREPIEAGTRLILHVRDARKSGPFRTIVVTVGGTFLDC